MISEQNIPTLENDKKLLPGFFHAMLLILLLAITTFIISYPIQQLGKIIPAFNVWVMFLSYTLTLWLVLVIAKKWWKVTFFDTKRVNIIVYILLAPLVVAMAILMEGLVSLIPMPEKMQQLFEQMVQINLQGFLTMAIAAPIFEELIFRGVVLKKFLQKYNPVKAIVLSALAFGIVHLNPWQFVAAFAIGLVIGWVYWKTASIWPGIFIHFTNNSLSFFLAKKYESINITFKDVIGNTNNYIALLILCILVCYSIYLLLNKYFKTGQAKTF